MTRKLTLEIAVESVAAAEAAERGGADRIELCADLVCGGLTPDALIMQETRASVKIPIHAMIRPRAGSFCYSDEEFFVMKKSTDVARELKMDGVVLGALRDDHSIDVERTIELVERARPMKVTFHRAFDECGDLLRGLEDVVRTGVDRILTSGGAPDAVVGRDTLHTLVKLAGRRIVIMPGAGITPDNFAAVALAIGASEYHSGLGRVLRYGSKDLSGFEEAVRSLAGLLIADAPGRIE
jgi:copper homeostasis protein